VWDAKEGKVGFEFEPRATKTAAKKTPAAKKAVAKE
jgi:DNA topoisomerase-3